jgi:hypothetical protein
VFVSSDAFALSGGLLDRDGDIGAHYTTSAAAGFCLRSRLLAFHASAVGPHSLAAKIPAKFDVSRRTPNHGDETLARQSLIIG